MTRHILYLIDSMIAYAGAERNLRHICRLLPKDKYRCSVVTFKTKEHIGDLDQFPCPVYVWPLKRTYDWNAVQVALRIRRLVRSEGVSIVHSFFETSDLWGAPVAKLSGVPVLVSSRRDIGILRSGKHRWAYPMVNHLYDQVLTVSDAVRRFSLQEGGLDPKNVRTLRNGIDLEQVAAARALQRASLGLDNASHVIATVGYIREVKGFDVLVRAAEIVCREFPKAVFLVIGGVIGGVAEELYYERLQELTRSLRLTENVRFLGNSNEVLSILKMCDAFSLLSRSEGLPNCLLEAMACGVPCVATNVGGTPEVLAEGQGGFLVPADDPRAAAERILLLLREPQRAKQVGEAGRRTVETQFSVQIMVRELERIYDSLWEGREPQ